MMKQATKMLFKLTATKLKIPPTILITNAKTASPAKNIMTSPSKLKNRKTAFIEYLF